MIWHSVYSSYCANVALAALALLKSNERETFSDVAKLLKVQMLMGNANKQITTKEAQRGSVDSCT